LFALVIAQSSQRKEPPQNPGLFTEPGLSPRETPFDMKFTSREVTAWGGLALLKRMLDGMGFKEAVRRWDLPPPGSNRGYLPEQLIEQLMVSIWCGAARFAHTDITRLDTTLVRLFGWGKAAGHKAIIRLFQRFDQPIATRVQTSSYRWLFDTLRLNPITLDVDSTVLTRWGSQMGRCSQGLQRQKQRPGKPPPADFWGAQNKSPAPFPVRGLCVVGRDRLELPTFCV
jgi:hypothetical protein